MSFKRIVVIGAGSIGLEAALYGLTLGHDVQVFEKGRVGQNMRQWGHARLFSPWRINPSPLGVETLRKVGIELPTPGAYLTGNEYVARYLEPLAASDPLKGRVKEETEVLHLGRDGIRKRDLIRGPRHDHAFCILAQGQRGEDIVETDAVLDCTASTESVNSNQKKKLGESDVSATGNSVEQAVKQRYSSAAKARQAALCCPVDYDSQYLEVIPPEIIERDYGCGDPSKHLRSGETVLDLGSGGGKICYIASQVVGSKGKVIGVDMNDEMLSLARRYRQEVGDRIGYHNVTFLKGRIQDLALDYGKVDAYLAEHPISSAGDLELFETWKENQRRSNPMIPTASVDVVVSNCVLNLVRSVDKTALFEEMHRVLKKGGRAVISDIVSDEDIPTHLRDDPELWSGCISGAFREDRFLRAFEDAGFYGIRILKRDEKPWQTVEGIEFRSATVEAFKGKEGPCLERYQAVVYKGPWRSVTDDDGHTLRRGEPTAVCDKTFRIYGSEPYRQDVAPIEPYEDIPFSEATAFDCRRDAVRSPRETKGLEYNVTQTTDAPCCGPDGNCC